MLSTLAVGPPPAVAEPIFAEKADSAGCRRGPAARLAREHERDGCPGCESSEANLDKSDREYLTDEQRRGTGCIAGRMPP